MSFIILKRGSKFVQLVFWIWWLDIAKYGNPDSTVCAIYGAISSPDRSIKTSVTKKVVIFYINIKMWY